MHCSHECGLLQRRVRFFNMRNIDWLSRSSSSGARKAQFSMFLEVAKSESQTLGF